MHSALVMADLADEGKPMTETIFAIVLCYHFAPGAGTDYCEVLNRVGYFRSHEECERVRKNLGLNPPSFTTTCMHKNIPTWQPD